MFRRIDHEPKTGAVGITLVDRGFGDLVGHLNPEEQRGVDGALLTVLDLR